MDVTAGAAATQKALDSVKSVPMWVLLGLGLCFALVWLFPPLFAPLPDSAKAAMPIALVLISTLTVCRLGGSLLAHIVERRRAALARDRERLLHLYGPLTALFLTRHVSICVGRSSPFLRQRLQNARSELGAYRRRSVALKRAWRALFDRQESSSAEVEFGGDFPLAPIVDLVTKEAGHVDGKLLRLVTRADRFRYEEPERALLTDEELALFEHIQAEHSRLSARVGWTG
jgi:hypothetical protein